MEQNQTWLFIFAIADSHGYKGLNEIKKLLGDIF